MAKDNNIKNKKRNNMANNSNGISKKHTVSKIELKGMEFFSHHGCFEQERIIGNHFVVNLSVWGDFSTPAATDNIEDAVNYQNLYDIVKQQMAIPSALLENVVNRIMEAVLEQFATLTAVEVTVDKINPPLGGKLYASSVTMRKER